MSVFKELTREQLLRFDAYLNSLPLPTSKESFEQHQKSLERLRLEDPELYGIILRMRDESVKAIRNER